MWIITEEGLVRYTGHEFDVIKPNPMDLNSLSSSRVKDVKQDKNGLFWISTGDGGLNAYNPNTGKFKHYRHDAKDASTLSTDNLLFMGKDEKDNLWIGSRYGLNFFDHATEKIIRFMPEPGVSGKLQGSPLSPIILDSKNVYLSSSAGFEYFDRLKQEWHFSRSSMLKVIQSRSLKMAFLR
ncbi:MAG: hypothetical protein IPO92_13830 [Saprospiraceae bacterium]|nr:hypothetical protein [Saprospiraceae bacterium]